jgi:hypothetical protein
MPHVITTVLWFASLALSKISRIWGGRGMVLLFPSVIVGLAMLDLIF